MQCHYEALGVTQDADASTIKKAHRKLAIQYHPDKNLNDETAAETFRLVQEAYECLSDPAERKWYDEHRDALLKGWSPNSGSSSDDVSMLFDVIPFMHAHCYTGYDDQDDKSFYAIYGHVFASLAKEEADAADASGNDNNNNNKHAHSLPFEFGNSQTPLNEVATFYQLWEGFVSQQSFAWADQYDTSQADHRRVKRAMDDENKKERKKARKARNDDVIALVRFCKRRDPRMKALKAQQDQLKMERQQQMAERKKQQKQNKQAAMEEWRQQAEQEAAQTEEMDRLAGRVRLADLEDDYDYGGGKKKGKKGKKGKKNKNKNQIEEEEQEENDNQDAGNEEDDQNGQNGENGENDEALVQADEIAEKQDDVTDENDSPEKDDTLQDQESDIGLTQEDDSDFSSSEEESEEPDVWRCECCKKDFKSQGQMDNHMKSKKHKEAFKKYQKRLEKELMEEMLDER